MADILLNTDYKYVNYYLVLVLATTAAIYIVRFKEKKEISGGKSRKLKLTRWFLNAFLIIQFIWFFLIPIYR